jgi:outer membrane immunogenic protein
MLACGIFGGRTMKKLLLGTAALIALAAGTPAMAADPVPVFNWTGFYLGVNVGGSWGRMNTNVLLAGAPFGGESHKMDGWLGGAQAGYNWQTGAWVFGVEADIQATSQKGTSNFPGRTPDIPAIPCILFDPPAPACIQGTGIPGVPGTPGVVSNRHELTWFGTLRGRLGVAATPTWLLYGTGGLAFGEVTTDAVFTIPTGSAAASFSDIRTGWVLGAGTEWAFWPGWSVKIEYLHIDLGDITHSFGSLAPFSGAFTARSHIVDDIARIGVNYKIGGG